MNTITVLAIDGGGMPQAEASVFVSCRAPPVDKG
jgi:hypothetical protein